MSTTPKILAFAGSARAGSLNKKLVNAAAQAARDAGAEVTVLDLKDYPLPIYDGDLEEAGGLPENARKLKDLFRAHQGLLIASPEYNSSITALLKNTLDWVSRTENDDEPPLAAYKGKAAALLAASPGALGGLRGLVHLRAILGNIGVIVLPEQTAVGRAHEALAVNEAGRLADERVARQVATVAGALARFLKKNAD